MNASEPWIVSTQEPSWSSGPCRGSDVCRASRYRPDQWNRRRANASASHTDASQAAAATRAAISRRLVEKNGRLVAFVRITSELRPRKSSVPAGRQHDGDLRGFSVLGGKDAAKRFSRLSRRSGRVCEADARWRAARRQTEGAQPAREPLPRRYPDCRTSRRRP